MNYFSFFQERKIDELIKNYFKVNSYTMLTECIFIDEKNKR